MDPAWVYMDPLLIQQDSRLVQLDSRWVQMDPKPVQLDSKPVHLDPPERLLSIVTHQVYFSETPFYDILCKPGLCVQEHTNLGVIPVILMRKNRQKTIRSKSVKNPHRNRFYFVLLTAGLLLTLLIQPVLGASTPTLRADGWLPFGAADTSAAANVTVTASSATEVRLQANIPGAWVDTLQSKDSADYSQLTVPQAGWSTEVGQAALPVLRRSVEIPFGADYRLEVVATKTAEVTLAELGLSPLYPRQAPVVKLPGAAERAPFDYDAAFYAADALTPASPVAVVHEAIVRGHRTLLLEVWPVAYNPAAGTLQLTSQVELRLALEGADVARTAEKVARYASPALDSRLAQRILNYSGTTQPFSMVGTGYLIITADEFVDTIQPLVDWKITKGHVVTVTPLSEVPGGGSGADIQAYITDAYNTWDTPPSFVLIVGDTNLVPASPDSTTTDLYYSAVDGADFLPDLGVGRFPGRTEEHITAMVDKVVNYESGLIPDNGWLGKTSFIATDDLWEIAEGTHNYVIDTHTEPYGFLGTFPNDPQPGGDKLYAISYGADTNDLLTHMGQGRWAIVYSGHGGTTSWAGPNFSQNNVHQLTNHDMPAFVGSHACVTGSFQDSECFGETWVREPNKGALAFWGASVSTYWDEDDELEKRYFDAMFYDGVFDLAGFTQAGLYGVYLVYPGMAEYYYEGYNILGDPATEMWLDVAIGTLNGTVTDCASSNPIEGAEAAVSQSIQDASLDAFTDPDGYYEMPVSPGLYNVTYSHPDYYLTTVEGVEILENQITTQDACLELAPAPVDIFEDDMESGDAAWEHAADQGSDDWALVTSDSHSPTHAWFSADVNSVSDKFLWQAVPVSLPAGDLEWIHLSFWHNYSFESGYDGGVLEVSTDGGASWDDLGDALIEHGYNSTLSTGYQNPLGGRSAWSGSSGGWVETVADLTAFQGQEVQIRFRMGTDSSVVGTGWWIDDLNFSYRPLEGGDTVHVGNIRMRARTVEDITLVLALVPILDQDGAPITGADVTAEWTLPNGRTKVRTVATRPGRGALFRVQARMDGLYTITVLDVAADGYTYDPSQNMETSEELTIP